MERAVFRAMAEMVRERMTWYSTDTHIPVVEKIQHARVFQSHAQTQRLIQQQAETTQSSDIDVA